MKEQPGYIYLIKAGEHYKIGKSMNAARRLQQLSMPSPAQLLHTIPVLDMNRAEKYLHQRFAAQRGHGEWFALSPDDIAWICSLRTVELAPEPSAVAPPPRDSENARHGSFMIELRVRDVAFRRGITTIKALAEQASLAYDTAADLWHGRMQRIDRDVLARVCKALDSQPGDLLEYVEDGESKRAPDLVGAAISSA